MRIDDFNDDEDFFQDENEQYTTDGVNEISAEVYDIMIDKYVRKNYSAIEQKGIDIQGLKLVAIDNTVLIQLKSTIQFMIQYFIELEEYEKCTLLSKYLPELSDV